MGFNLVEKLLGITLFGTEWVLWLLIILSIVSLAIVIERFLFFKAMTLDFKQFSQVLTDHLSQNNFDQLQKVCEGSPAIESQVILRGLACRSKGKNAMEGAMNGYMIGHKQELDRGLTVLGTLGNNAPFIGLFGTVLGIIIAFHQLASNPAGGPSVVMSGISEALIATAVGLIVAIPAVVFYNYFQRIVRRRMNQSEAVSKLLLTYIS